MGREVFSKFFRTYPQGFAQLLSVEGACVTGLPLMSPVLHYVVPQPPSFGRGLSPEATEDSRPFKERLRP